MKIQLVGIPSFAGALHSGTELAPAALRQAGLRERLQAHGVEVEDRGDLPLPSYLPRHNVPPVRNWPAPRMIWEATTAKAASWWSDEQRTLVLGGDCSIVVGTMTSFLAAYGERAHLLVVDGHLDAVPPSAGRCVGAAGMGLWFLTEDANVWWSGSLLDKSRLAVLGCQVPPADTCGIPVTLLDEMREGGIRETVSNLFDRWPADAKILLHFDVDVLHRDFMSAAYSPSERGLNAEEARDLLAAVLADPRVAALEVTEFSGLRDVDDSQAQFLAELLANALAR